MQIILSTGLCAVFALLGAWHLYWASGGKVAMGGAVPEVGGRPAFSPTRASTAAVGVALLACSALIAVCGHLTGPLLPPTVGSGLCFALALALALRAIGDFRLVGFFKRVRGSTFARRDTVVYSPLCLLLAAGVFVIGRGYAG